MKAVTQDRVRREDKKKGGIAPPLVSDLLQ